MLLAIDIGNTNITLGVFEGESIKAMWRLATDTNRMPDEYGLMLRHLLPLRGVQPDEIDTVAVCSVVPPLTQVFSQLCRDFFNIKPLVVGAGVKTGIKILYDNPRDVGTDRIVDAAAAYRLYGAPLVIVDFGTPTVFDAISAQGEYIGGAIAPGLRVAAESLVSATSQLRRVEMVAPATAVGRNTVHALQSGIVLGHVDMVEGMVRRFKRELGGSARVVGTGHGAPLIAEQSSVFDAISIDLTLIGLRMIHDLNRGKGQAVP